MSVFVMDNEELKGLELAVMALTELSPLLFPALRRGNIAAFEHTYEEEGERWTDAEHAADASAYRACKAIPMTPDARAVLKKLHLLSYNLDANDGTRHISPETEVLRRAAVQGVAFECLTPGGPGARLGAFTEIRRLPTGPGLEDRYQVAALDDHDQAYLMEDGQPHPLHGRIYADLPHLAFQAAWVMEDRCAQVWEVRHSAALRLLAAEYGLNDAPALSA